MSNLLNKTADDFFNSVDFPSIISTIKDVYSSDGVMSTLLDFERVLDEADLYAYKNWDLGELVSGPNIRRYDVSCIFMYPNKLMPDPRGAKRLLTVGCNIKFKKTKIKVPIKIEGPEDYKPGTHYPKMTERDVWLVFIEMPKELMNDIREGSIDLAGQTVNLEDLDTAYEDNLDEEGTETEERQQGESPEDMSMGMGGPAPMPGLGAI
jgi:hypothetical protein